MRGDVARPGMALYGGNPFAERPNPMSAVVTLIAPIVQIRDIDDACKPSATARRYVARRPRGSRSSAPATPTAIRASSAIAASQRSPDDARRWSAACRWTCSACDVSALPPDVVRVGAPVEALGPNVPLDEVAAAAGTISYEILTRLSPRLKREYRGE